jgi:hypothetical protein
MPQVLRNGKPLTITSSKDDEDINHDTAMRNWRRNHQTRTKADFACIGHCAPFTWRGTPRHSKHHRKLRM